MATVWMTKASAQTLLDKGDVKPHQVWQNMSNLDLALVCGVEASEVDCDLLAQQAHEEYYREMEEECERRIRQDAERETVRGAGELAGGQHPDQ